MNKTLRILLIVLGAAMIVSGVMKISDARGEAAEGTPVPFETSVELNDGSGNPVATLTTHQIDTSVERQVTVTYTLTNRGEHPLTQLNFNVSYFDADGNELRDKPIYVMTGLMYAPVQPGETREFVKAHYFDGAENAAAVALEPLGVKDDIELPPWTEPQPNNLLLDFCNYEPFSAYFENLDTNPPVQMIYQRDQVEETVITDVDEILAEIQSLKNMRIGEESDQTICDAGISYWFTMADGTEWGVSFEAPGLFCWHNKVYKVIND